MKIAVIHDYADVFRGTRAYPRLQEHEVIIHTEASTDPARVIAQVAGCDALLLTQQRVPLTRQIIERLPELRCISQTGRNTNHLDLPACTEHGIVVSAGGGSGGGSPYSTTAELTWGLILASLRHLPYEVERLKHGQWQATVGTRLFGRTLGVYAFGHIGAPWRAWAKRLACTSCAGAARARRPGPGPRASRSLPAAKHFSSRPTCSACTCRATARPVASSRRTTWPACSRPRCWSIPVARRLSRKGPWSPRCTRGGLDSRRSTCTKTSRSSTRQHPLLQMPNALCTPHLGYAERGSYEALYTLAVDQLLAFAAGQPINVANPEAVGKR